MKISGKIDAHCHLFNIQYGIKEALNIYWDWINGTYPADIPDEHKEHEQKEQYITHSMKTLFGWLFSTCAAIFLNDTNHYLEIEKNSRSPHGWDSEISAVFPLMMDIFYIFARPILQAGEKYNEGTTAAKGKPIPAPGTEHTTFHSWAGDLISHIKSMTHNWSKELLSTIDMFINGFFEWPHHNKHNTQGAFKDTWGFHHQRQELLELQNEYPGKIYPFFAVDPRRPGVVEKAKECLQPAGGFYGIKLYTYMGYHPASAALMPLYDYCAAKDIPITVHCSRNGFPSADWPYAHLADPALWEPILQKYEKLRVNFAHFGLSPDISFLDWARTIKRYLEKYENVYSDFACYTTNQLVALSSTFWNDNAYIREKVMFGTDYVVMPLAPGGEGLKSYFREFRKHFSTESIEKMAVENPRKFLKLDS